MIAPAPPRLATALLRLLLSEEDFEAVSGDLEEMYRTDVLPRAGMRAAHRWYRQQAVNVAMARLVTGWTPRSLSPRFLMTAFRQDLSYAVRALRKQPGFALVAVLTLALGIGANVAIFSLVNAVLFKRLPFDDPDRLMLVHLLSPDRESPGVFRVFTWSYPKYQVFREQQDAFARTAIFIDNQWNLTGFDAPERLEGEFVEASYFATLGIPPQLGRAFSPEEAQTPGSAPLVMLSDGLWQRLFGGDRAILGRTIGLNGTPHTIVGVLPPGFSGLTGQAQVWVPVTTQSAADLAEPWNHTYELVARRKPEVTQGQADAAVRLLGARVHAVYAGPSAGERAPWSASAAALNDERIDPLIRRSVVLMQVAVAAVLLIVCVNLASLMLARALGRQREVAIRGALGASRWRIVRQLMTESLVLATLGAMGGLLVGYAFVATAAQLLPDLRMVLPPRTAGLTRVGLSALSLDTTTLLFTLAIAMTTAMVFGLGPAWRASRRDMTSTMRAGATGSVSQGTSGFALGGSLIAAEIAVALVLLVAGGLMLKSVARLQATELGFAPASRLTFRLTLPSPQYDRPRATQVLLDLVDRLAARSDIQHVGYSSCAPLAGPCNGTSVRFPDRPPAAPGASPSVGVLWASPGYFDTLGIRVIRGRTFSADDRAGHPKVVVVNETFVREHFGAADPLGTRISVGQGGFGDGAEIVGVVADVKYSAVEAAPRPDVYLPLLQSGRSWGVIAVASQTPPALLIPALRREVQALDPNLPLVDIKTMDARFGDATWRTRMSAWLLGAFATLALVLAAVGIYGVISQGVAQRSREIGVRLALGASRADILRLILGRALVLALAGVAIGVVVTPPSMKLLSVMLYQVRPGDPGVIATLAVLLVLVAALAAYLPARRATRLDPLTTLRSE